MRGKWKRIKRMSVALFLAATVTFGVVGDTTRVLAQTEPTFDQGFFSSNDIFFYDPTYQAVCAGGGLVGGSTKEKIWNFFIANDLSPEQAAGIMGNIQEESGFIPSNYEGEDEYNLWAEGLQKGWGLVQWTGGRRYTSPDGGVLGTLRKEKPHLEKYTEFQYDKIGEPNDKFPAKDFDELLLFQLDYMMQESMSRDHRPGEGFDGSSSNEWERLKEQSTARKAAIYWHWAFERSNDSPSQITERLDAAEAIFEEFKDNLSAAGSGTTGCAAAGDLQELTLAYAWPEYHPPSFAQKKPAYAEAVRTAIDDNRYVGTRQSGYEGVDCGGFVTLLITNSGHDPTYNSDGRGGPTGSQLSWLRDESNGWRPLGRGGSFDPNILKPGDVAIYNDGDNGHTFVYVGKEMVEMGFGGNGSEPGIASASIGSTWRAPMAGGESPADSTFEWFTKG